MTEDQYQPFQGAEADGETTAASQKTFMLADEVQYGYHPICSQQIQVGYMACLHLLCGQANQYGCVRSSWMTGRWP